MLVRLHVVKQYLEKKWALDKEIFMKKKDSHMVGDACIVASSISFVRSRVGSEV